MPSTPSQCPRGQRVYDPKTGSLLVTSFDYDTEIIPTSARVQPVTFKGECRNAFLAASAAPLGKLFEVHSVGGYVSIAKVVKQDAESVTVDMLVFVWPAVASHPPDQLLIKEVLPCSPKPNDWGLENVAEVVNHQLAVSNSVREERRAEAVVYIAPVFEKPHWNLVSQIENWKKSVRTNLDYFQAQMGTQVRAMLMLNPYYDIDRDQSSINDAGEECTFDWNKLPSGDNLIVIHGHGDTCGVPQWSEGPGVFGLFLRWLTGRALGTGGRIVLLYCFAGNGLFARDVHTSFSFCGSTERTIRDTVLLPIFDQRRKDGVENVTTIVNYHAYSSIKHWSSIPSSSSTSNPTAAFWKSGQWDGSQASFEGTVSVNFSNSWEALDRLIKWITRDELSKKAAPPAAVGEAGEAASQPHTQEFDEPWHPLFGGTLDADGTDFNAPKLAHWQNQLLGEQQVEVFRSEQHLRRFAQIVFFHAMKKSSVPEECRNAVLRRFISLFTDDDGTSDTGINVVDQDTATSVLGKLGAWSDDNQPDVGPSPWFPSRLMPFMRVKCVASEVCGE